MIEKGDHVVLKTEDAIYCTCEILDISEQNVKVTYAAGTKKDRKTGELFQDWKIETIARRKIVSMSERT